MRLGLWHCARRALSLARLRGLKAAPARAATAAAAGPPPSSAGGGQQLPARQAAEPANLGTAGKVSGSATGSELEPADRLLRFLADYGIADTPAAGAGAAAGDAVELAPELAACRVKSLVFLVNDAPLVVVLPLEQRVDRRRLAAMLGVRSGGVSLAPVDQLPQLCGFPVGAVPPLGHSPRLPVVVDQTVLQHSHCLVGGGSSSGGDSSGSSGAAGSEEHPQLLRLAVADVVRVTDATVGALSSGPLSSGGSGSSGSEGSALGSCDGGAAGAAAGDGAEAVALRVPSVAARGAGVAALPVPWEAGAETVTLEGLIAQKRKIARLLVFANLVPTPALAAAAAPEGQPGDVACQQPPAPRAPGSVTHLRRLWRCPEAGAGGEARACEVQLILGKTLSERLGKDSAADLMRGLRVGSLVWVVGRPQPHPSPPHGTRREDVLDVVVHEFEVLSPPTFQLLAAALVEPSQLTALSQSPAPAAAAGPGRQRGGRQPAAARGGSTAPCLELPPAVEAGVVLVDCEAGLRQLEAALWGPDAESLGAEAGSSSALETSSSSSSSEGEPHAVLGVDCEWQPYARGEPHTPVALLQLALRPWRRPGAGAAAATVPAGGEQQQGEEGGEGSAHEADEAAGQQVFLLDMLALCRSQLAQPTAAAGADQGGGAAPALPAGDRGTAHEVAPAAAELTAAEALLSGILERAFADPALIVVGFKLSHDLKRLCESYPHLPCFGSQGPVPVRSHVDVLLLAQAVLPSLGGRGAAKRRRARSGLGLSALTALVLGRQLDKSEQCSDWAARPLSAAQRAYAAVDAYALVTLFWDLLQNHQQQLRQQQPPRGALPLKPLGPAWMVYMAGGLTDVAAFRPGSSGGSLLCGGSSSSDDGEDTGPLGPLARHRQRLGAVGARPSGSGSSGGEGVSLSGTLRMRCNVAHLLQQYLGQALPEGGKPPAVRAGAADDSCAEPGRTPSFPRGSGVLEWSNAFMLFVNLQPLGAGAASPGASSSGSGGSRYDNRFFWGEEQQAAETEAGPGQPGGKGGQEQGERAGEGRQRLYVTWWPGRGQTREHPVMQRMLGGGSSKHGPNSAAASGEAGVAVEPGQPPAVLLFCRPPGRPYVFCGRLQQAQGLATTSSGGAGSDGAAATAVAVDSSCVVWELLDLPALRGSPAFERLLALHQLQ